MNATGLRQIFSIRDVRRAAVGFVVVFGGLGLAAITYFAHLTGDNVIAAITASVSLLFVLLILVFVVPPLARDAGREASRLDIPFELTLSGVAVLSMIMVVGFSAWSTGNNLLFLILSFMIGGTVVGFVYGSLSLRKLDVKLRFAETIIAGENTPILLTVTNRKKLLPAVSVIVDVRGKERERSLAAKDLQALLPGFIARRLSSAPTVRHTLGHVLYVPARRSAEQHAQYVFPRRGRLRIHDFELSTGAPFGFFRHRRRLAAREAELLVFPALLPHAALAARAVESGTRPMAIKGSGDDLAGMRQYQAPDDPRRIDWKATARVQTLIVREVAAEASGRYTVIFDRLLPEEEKEPSLREKMNLERVGGHSATLSRRFENGVSITASILSELSKTDAEFRMVEELRDLDDPFATARDGLYRQLSRLAVCQPIFYAGAEPDDLYTRMLNETTSGQIILVTAREVPAGLVSLANMEVVRY